MAGDDMEKVWQIIKANSPLHQCEIQGMLPVADALDSLDYLQAIHEIELAVNVDIPNATAKRLYGGKLHELIAHVKALCDGR